MPINLTENQKELLRQLVAADKEGRFKGRPIIVLDSINTADLTIIGLNEFQPRYGDFEALVEAGFLQVDHVGKRQKSYVITGLGYKAIENNFDETIYELDKAKKEEEILQLLKELRDKSDNEETFLQKANSIFLLQPNFAGIGINMNELIGRFLKKK